MSSKFSNGLADRGMTTTFVLILRGVASTMTTIMRMSWWTIGRYYRAVWRSPSPFIAVLARVVLLMTVFLLLETVTLAIRGDLARLVELAASWGFQGTMVFGGGFVDWVGRGCPDFAPPTPGGDGVG